LKEHDHSTSCAKGIVGILKHLLCSIPKDSRIDSENSSKIVAVSDINTTGVEANATTVNITHRMSVSYVALM
jgi:hypothetical protein